jgi:glycosyltransferase involved in cell wall biosynthesis
MRFLFLAVHCPNRSPAQRYRIEQFFPALRERGIRVEYSWLLDDDAANLLYSPGRVAAKAVLTLKTVVRRWFESRSLGEYDLVFVQREALFLGGPFVELRAKARGAKLVFDFDDAIWLADTSDFNKRFAWLKNRDKVGQTIAAADLVIAGNEYLGDYARRWNGRVAIVPTTVDTDRHVPPRSRETGPVCIGWSGSFSTVKHLTPALPALRRIKQRFGDRVRFVVLGDSSFQDDVLQVRGQGWRPESEVADLQQIDVGIMPLPDDAWSRGKCGFKALLYMAHGAPAVVSPVGVNTLIVDHGKNGFLASGDEEWEQVLARLVEDPALRATVGAAGRRTVEDRYSVRAWQKPFCDLLTSVVTGEAEDAAQVGAAV